MLKQLFVVCILVSSAATSVAQGPLQRGAALRAAKDESTNKRNDVEGTIWEFKVMDNDERDRSQKTKMTGRLRIKQTSVYAVGEVEMQDAPPALGSAADMMKAYDANGDQKLDVAELDSLLTAMKAGNGQSKPPAPAAAGKRAGNTGSIPGELQGLLSQRISQAQEEGTGGERIGDLTKSGSSESRFRFDEDDDHPLSGIVVVRPDTTNRNGVWFGYYDEFADGAKKARWRIEMRKVED